MVIIYIIVLISIIGLYLGLNKCESMTEKVVLIASFILFMSLVIRYVYLSNNEGFKVVKIDEEEFLNNVEALDEEANIKREKQNNTANKQKRVIKKTKNNKKKHSNSNKKNNREAFSSSSDEETSDNSLDVDNNKFMLSMSNNDKANAFNPSVMVNLGDDNSKSPKKQSLEEKFYSDSGRSRYDFEKQRNDLRNDINKLLTEYKILEYKQSRYGDLNVELSDIEIKEIEEEILNSNNFEKSRPFAINDPEKLKGVTRGKFKPGYAYLPPEDWDIHYEKQISCRKAPTTYPDTRKLPIAMMDPGTPINALELDNEGNIASTEEFAPLTSVGSIIPKFNYTEDV